MKYIYIVLFLCFSIGYLSQDTIVLREDKFYDLNIIKKDFNYKDSIEKIVIVKNESNRETWFIKYDNWGEVSVELKDSVFVGGWDYPYNKDNFYFSSARRGPTIPLSLKKGKFLKLKFKFFYPISRSYSKGNKCGILYSDSIGTIYSFRVVLIGNMIIILLVLAIYHFFLFFITRDDNFVRYSLTQIIFALLWFNAFGLSVYFFEFDLSYLRFFDNFFALLYIGVYFWFTRGYLDTKKEEHNLDFYLLTFQRTVLASAFISFFVMFYSIDYVDTIASFFIVYIFSPLGVVLLIISIVKAIINKNKLVTYFWLAMLTFIVSIVIMNVGVIHSMSDSLLMKNAVLFGAVFEAILFSVGLAAKIKIAQEEKEETQDKLLTQLKENETIKDEFNKGLERKVEERTVELEQKNKIIESTLRDKEVLIREVHHRVKNNLQLMYSFMSLQSNRSKDEFVKQEILESKERVRTLAMIHDKLSLAENTEEVDVEEYIPDIIHHLVKLAVKEEVKTIIKVESIILPVKKAVSLGLVVNEIITNSLKYAEPIPPEGKKIYVEVVKKNNDLELVISDNGKMIKKNVEEREKSLGSLIIKDLCKQLKATLEIDDEFNYVVTAPID